MDDIYKIQKINKIGKMDKIDKRYFDNVEKKLKRYKKAFKIN